MPAESEFGPGWGEVYSWAFGCGWDAGAENERQEIAARIRAELVCCDCYDGSGDIPPGHAICYWGEAAARLAEENA